MLQSITEEWADGTHTFRLDQAGWLELDRKLDRGPLEIFDGLRSHKWRVTWPGEIIRVGLIGGGMKPPEAFKLVQAYVNARPLLESLPLAVRIVEIGLFQPAEATASPGEPQAGEASSGGSTPQPSTETQPS
jgi:hypothetical protein